MRVDFAQGRMHEHSTLQRAERPGRTTSTNQTLFSNFECYQLSVEERQYLHAARMGDMILLKQILDSTDNKELNWNCVDYMGRNALHLAVDSENIDMIETLIERVSFECLEEGLLNAISKGLLTIVRLIIDHPKYKCEHAKQLKVIGKKDAFFRKEEKYQYPPDITPLILAAHHNDHEIIQFLISREFTIERPHPIHCPCQDCRYKQQCDSLKRSRSRLHAYKALASPAYLALSSPHPISESFRLRKELIEIAFKEKEFKKDYLELVEQCLDFTCRTMCLCRGTQEMEAILGETSELDAPLARLRLAVNNEEKKFVAHPNTQQHLKNLWYGEEMRFIEAWALWKKFIAFLVSPILMPCFCVIYLLCPNSWIGRAMRCPVSKFITHTLSYLIFLCLLAATTLENQTKEMGCDDLPYNFSNSDIDRVLQDSFRPEAAENHSALHFLETLIALYVLGSLFLECKQVYNCSVKDHLTQYCNIIDFSILSLYLASYVLKFLIHFRLNAENEEIYVNEARQALEARDCELFTQIRDESYTNNYFMRPSPFQWQWYDPEIVSNVLFALANVLSFARTTYWMPFHELLGPLQISLGKMMGDIVRFMVLFVLVLLAFMVGMTSLYTHYRIADDTRNETTNKIVESFNGPWQTYNTLFFSIFGLVDLEELEIKMPKTNITVNQDSTLLIHSISLVLFATFQVLVTIVLVNMLIAMMSNSFEVVQGDTDVEWKFARTKLWLNFIDEGSTLPVPFNIIPSCKTFRYMYQWCCDLLSGNEHDLSHNEYDFSRRRGPIELEDWHAPQHSDYSDMIQRIMRRYLFTMDRQKVEKEKKEGIVYSSDACDGYEEDTSAANFKGEHGGERNAVYQRQRGQENSVSRTGRFSAIRRRCTATNKLNNSTQQLDAIQTGQRLLDARMQDLSEFKADNEAMQKNVNEMQEILSQSQRDIDSLLKTARDMSSEILTLTQAVNHCTNRNVKATRSLQSSRSFENRDVDTPFPRNRIESAYRAGCNDDVTDGICDVTTVSEISAAAAELTDVMVATANIGSRGGSTYKRSKSDNSSPNGRFKRKRSSRLSFLQRTIKKSKQEQDIDE